MRLLLDEHISTVAAMELCRRGHDVVTATQVGLDGRPDAEVFAWATEERRAVVTADLRDFPLLHKAAISRDEPCWGLILLPRPEWTTADCIGRLVRALDELLRAHPAEHALQTAERWLPWSLD